MNHDDFKKLLEEALEPIKQNQESHSAALINIESKLDAFADSYKTNQHNIERLDTRLSNVENHLEIDVSEDLKVPHFSSK